MLSVYNIEQAIEWDAIVKSFKNYDVYWLSGYVKAFQLHGDGMPLLFYYEDNATKGINVVMKRDVAQDKHLVGLIEENVYFDFASPYGYGGWLIEGQISDRLFSEYETWCKKNGIICEFVRFHPVLKNHIHLDRGYEVIPLGETIAMDTATENLIWENMTSKNRNMVRKAQKNGVKIYRAQNPEIYKIFREIYNQTMDKDQADSYYYFEESFYESILMDLPQNAQVFYAVLEDKIIAASIMLSANGRMNYHLSGSLKTYQNLAPSNLLLYEAALWGCANGCKTLYLGGGVGSGEDSLFKFKRAFYRGDDLNRFHIGKKIFISERYEELVAKRQIVDNDGFFPMYRG